MARLVRDSSAEWNVVLAGDLKGLVYYAKEERIRIHLWTWANIQNCGYRE